MGTKNPYALVVCVCCDVRARDDFLIQHCQRISKRDFKMKTESASHGKREK